MPRSSMVACQSAEEEGNAQGERGGGGGREVGWVRSGSREVGWEVRSGSEVRGERGRGGSTYRLQVYV